MSNSTAAIDHDGGRTVGFLAVAEVLLAFAHFGLGLGLVAIVIAHFAVVGAAARRILAAESAGADMTGPALLLVATAAAGPIGVLAGWSLMRSTPAERAAECPLLDDWYRRIARSATIDPVTELCDNVASGRTMNLASALPQSFLSVMASGSIAEQQTALGLIARRFHPDYLPALTRALRSPEPVIRVQAAAVVARIRDQLQASVRSRLAELEAVAPSHADPAGLAELSRAVESGLLEETDRLHACAVIARLSADTHLPQPPSAAGSTGHKFLRVAHRKRRINSNGQFRVRSLRQTPPSQDGAA